MVKFETVLMRMTLAQKQMLAGEFAKIAPVNTASEIVWEASWVYDFDENIVHGSFFIKINPAQDAKNVFNLKTHFERLLQNVEINDLERISETLHQFIDYTVGNLEMKLTPAMYLKEEIGVIHFGLNGKMKDWETVEWLKENLATEKGLQDLLSQHSIRTFSEIIEEQFSL